MVKEEESRKRISTDLQQVEQQKERNYSLHLIQFRARGLATRIFWNATHANILSK